jgi:prepilin-type N-terminal cleavage/methylation domain-containing protein
MKNKTRKVRPAGFTLIELMIVVAIIGILAAIAIPKFSVLIRKSHEGATKGKLSALRAALRIYNGDTEGLYPADDLTCLIRDGRYINAIPEADIPPYHTKSSEVKNNDDLGTGIILTADTGGWLYWNWAAGVPSRHWGDIWIGCTHAGTTGIPWTSF